MDISHVVINSDCLLVVQASFSVAEDLSPLGNLIEDIKHLLSSSPFISISHAYRNSNSVISLV